MDCIALRHTHTTSLRCHPHVPTFEPCPTRDTFYKCSVQGNVRRVRQAVTEKRRRDEIRRTRASLGAEAARNPGGISAGPRRTATRRNRARAGGEGGRGVDGRKGGG